MKKKILALLLTAAMVFSMAACGSGDGDDGNSSGGNSSAGNSGNENSDAGNSGDENKSGDVTVITLWSMAAEDNDPTKVSSRIQKVMDDFNASHDDIRVEVSFGKTYDNIVTAIAASDTPDLFQMYWQNASPLSANGALYDLTDFVNNDADFDKADFLDKAWKLCTVGDRIYSIPYTASTSFAFYNIKTLKEAGWDEFPTTVEDLVQCTKDCYDLESTTMGFSPFIPWMDQVLWPAMMEASWEDENGNPTFNNNEAMSKAYSVQKELADYQGGYSSLLDWGSDWGKSMMGVTSPILTGGCGFELYPDNNIATLYNAGVEAQKVYGEDWKIASVPGNSMFTAAVYEMNAKTKNPEAAWEVLSYLTSKDVMMYMAEGENNAGALMPRVSGLEAVQNMDSVCEGVKEAAEIIKNAELQSFPMSAYVGEYLGFIGDYMQRYMEGTIELDEAMNSVQEETVKAKAEVEERLGIN